MHKITHKWYVYFNALLILTSSCIFHASERRFDQKNKEIVQWCINFIAQLRTTFDATLMPYTDKKESRWNRSPLASSPSCTNLLKTFTIAKGQHYYYNTSNFQWYRFIERPFFSQSQSVSVTPAELELLRTKIAAIPCSTDGLGRHLQQSYLNDIKDFIRVIHSRAQPSCHNKPKS